MQNVTGVVFLRRMIHAGRGGVGPCHQQRVKVHQTGIEYAARIHICQIARGLPQSDKKEM